MLEEDLRSLVLVGEERRNLEYKGPMRWDDDDTKMKIAKTVLGMSNIRDGGWIVLGIREQAGLFVRVGLPQPDADTFKVDDIASFVNEYADPYVTIHVYQFTFDGRKYVIIKVEEFEDVPVICKKDYQNAKLFKGRVYTRSRRRNETSEVLTQSEMREIVDLAVDKNTRKLFERLKRLGITSLSVSTANEEAFRNQLGDPI